VSTTAVLTSLGGQVRLARERRSLTLDAVARRTGLSKAHLSRIESGDRQPAIATLLTLAHALEVRVATLLGEESGEVSLSIHQPAASPTRTVNGLQVTSCSGYRGSRDLEALHLHIEADRPVPDFASHPGEEWLHVLHGTVHLEYLTTVHRLATGTSAHFDSEQPHRLGAPEGGAELLLVASATRRGFAQLHS
jgi:transcriptional regulator with XRE-family HTH domain